MAAFEKSDSQGGSFTHSNIVLGGIRHQGVTVSGYDCRRFEHSRAASAPPSWGSCETGRTPGTQKRIAFTSWQRLAFQNSTLLEDLVFMRARRRMHKTPCLSIEKVISDDRGQQELVDPILDPSVAAPMGRSDAHFKMAAEWR